MKYFCVYEDLLTDLCGVSRLLLFCVFLMPVAFYMCCAILSFVLQLYFYISTQFDSNLTINFSFGRSNLKKNKKMYCRNSVCGVIVLFSVQAIVFMHIFAA